MAALKNVLLLGGAGTLGPPLTSALLKAGGFKISVLSRPTSKSTFPSGVKKLTSDFTPTSLAESFKGQDAVIDLIAQASVDERKKIVDAAVSAGVKRFIPSEFSGNMENKTNVAIFSLFATRVATAEYAKEKAASNPSFTYTILSTGPFYDWCIGNGFIGFNLQTSTATIYDDGNQNFSVTTLGSIAQAVVSILSKPKETANKRLYIASFSPTQNEILSVLEELTGKKWKTEKISTEDAKVKGFEALGKGDFSGIANIVMSSTYGPANGNDFSKNATLSNDLLGLPKEDLKTVTKAVVDSVGK